MYTELVKRLISLLHNTLQFSYFLKWAIEISIEQKGRLKTRNFEFSFLWSNSSNSKGSRRLRLWTNDKIWRKKFHIYYPWSQLLVPKEASLLNHSNLKNKRIVQEPRLYTFEASFLSLQMASGRASRHCVKSAMLWIFCHWK